jgi:hypothetical protein
MFHVKHCVFELTPTVWTAYRQLGGCLTYWILIFNQHPLGQPSGESLVSTLRSANIYSLSRQYGLDPAQIPAALDHIDVETSAGGYVPYFLVRYQPKDQPPIVVTEWTVSTETGSQFLRAVIAANQPPNHGEQLRKTRFIYSVPLERAQLADLGILFAYEIARWVATQGAGWVLGLDGVWYRLNQHQAFIPLEPERKSS